MDLRFNDSACIFQLQAYDNYLKRTKVGLSDQISSKSSVHDGYLAPCFTVYFQLVTMEATI